MITVGMSVALGEAFVIPRNRQGYTTAEIAREAAVPARAIRDIEHDRYSRIAISEVIALAGVYDLYLHVGLTPQESQLLGTERKNTDKEIDGE